MTPPVVIVGKSDGSKDVFDGVCPRCKRQIEGLMPAKCPFCGKDLKS